VGAGQGRDSATGFPGAVGGHLGEDHVTAGESALPRILYIAGLMRSGTTVLGIMLGGIPGAIFVGELQSFWRRFAENELCSCGEPLPDCPFWSEVLEKAFGQVTRERAHELNSLEEAVFSPRRRGEYLHYLRVPEWLALTPLQWPARKSRRIGVMLAERARLYRAIGEVANATYVVDSGKLPIYGCVIARMGGADLSTIHIVRDPRGVAFSWHHRIHWPDTVPRSRFIRTPALSWVRDNLLIQFSLQRLGKAYVRVRYEDLAQRPADIKRTIVEATSAPAGHGRLVTATKLAEGEHHWVAGNRGVRKHLGEGLPLTLDEEWRTRMPRKELWLVTAVCSVLMAAYGYGLRSSRLRGGHARER
jgi:hypothetical protein